MDCEAGFLSFAMRALSSAGQSPARHHRLLIAKLQEVAAGTCDRLMVQMPPGAAKSTYGSVLFPAYFLAARPLMQIIATAHTASLADHFGRQVRDVIGLHKDFLGVSVCKESKASTRFRVSRGGEYFAAGVHGPITGRRADLILIDDPIKSWGDAESLNVRDGLYDWYRAELTARLKPGGRVVLLMTRWHEDDLAGRLMRAEAGWDCLVLPALAKAGDPLGRAVGEALWPEVQDVVAVERRRREVGERAFAAMYQQAPRPPDTALFKITTIAIFAETPPLVRSIRAWDLAATSATAARDPDYTVGLKLGLSTAGKLLVLDVIRMRGSPGEVEARIIAAAKTDGTGTVVALPQDPGQAGAAQIAMLSARLTGFHVLASPETGTKVMRAMPAAAQVDNGNIGILAGPWNENFLSELSAFPESAKDDQVDALSRAVNTMATTSGTLARRINVPLLAR